MIKKKTRQIAPRLANGKSRITWGGRLPPMIKMGVQVIARRENKSVSYMLEEIVIDYFTMDKPKYLFTKRKK